MCIPHWGHHGLRNWAKLTLFADGNCSRTTFGKEAQQLRTALDERLWKKAKQASSRLGYLGHLNATSVAPIDITSDYLDFLPASGGACAFEAETQVRDFDAWAGASKADATCHDVARYIEDFRSGRFIAAAKTKLRTLIAREKSGQPGQTDRGAAAEWGGSCTNYEHLLQQKPPRHRKSYSMITLFLDHHPRRLFVEAR